ncbi:MAG: 3-hydroxyacyl-CoA dehydrogenase NAD-binding domain-containing protein [Chloroflexota bacterium]|nr:3-hydroxyacyl-CoA dehydrogenase NAD-binding domain-containing protein [Chloroflexota bacterium]
MTYKINHAVVVGAGTMGAAIAAHLANAGIAVTLLDIVPRNLTDKEKAKGLTLDDTVVRNRIVNAGLQRALKSRPASFYSKELADLVTTGNLEDDFDAIVETDWVIEVIIENLHIKQDLMARIDKVRPDDCIVSTNTSGIPVSSIAEGLSEGFRQHFLGTHFFNPPRYLKLLEIIPIAETLPEVVKFISHFGEYCLGKGIVPCKDTPNFIANRLGFGSGAFALDYILENGYTVKEVDTITGPAIGHPKTATFRLIDLVGVDVWEHVGTNLAQAIPHDEHALRYLNSEPANDLIHTMVEKGWLGNKSKQGFYKMVKKEFWSLNLETLEYELEEKPKFESIGEAKGKETLAEKLEVLLAAEDRAGELVQAMMYQELAYASERIPEIADTPKPIDDAMRWGFGRKAGPFEVWDMLGVTKVAEAMKKAGFPPADWVAAMVDNGFDKFYQYDGNQKVGAYNPTKQAYETIERSSAAILLKEQKDAGKIVSRNPGATLVDLGDGVACVEFQTKMNAIDDDIMGMMNEAMDRAEAGEFNGIIIGNEAERAFSAGANLFGVVMAAQNGMWDQLENMVKVLQDTNMRMRYFPKPVIVAPHGLTLGGGGEITMHGNRVVAAAELYIGQVEIGAGVIPAGGGTKELLRRIVNPAMRVKDVAVLPFMQKVFEIIGQAKVATSAVEARQYGFLGSSDRIVLNRDHLLAEAKKEVLHMLDTGHRPPAPEKIYAAGRDTLAALRAGVQMFEDGGYITEYEAYIGEKMIYVMTGGELSAPAWVDEQYILDLEREAFLSLCGEEKTQERIWALLRTGKVKRN